MSSKTQTVFLREKLESIGHRLPDKEFELVRGEFGNLIQIKTPLDDGDLHMLVQEVLIQKEKTVEDLITVERVDYRREQNVLSAKVVLSKNGVKFEAVGSGGGPIASVWAAITGAIFREAFLSSEAEFKDFKIFAEPGGVEARGLATICIEDNGRIAYARGVDSDIILASVKAIVSAINHLLYVPVESVLV